jgi:Protein of unknown function (DUF2975)
MLNNKKWMSFKMNEKASSPSNTSFKRLNYVFWVIWALLPFLFYKLWLLLNDPAIFTEGLTPEQLNCMKDIVNPASFSTVGTFLYNLPLLSAFVFYFILIFSFHRMVLRFANGGAFDSHTLNNMKILGCTLIGFPIFDFALGYFVSAGLQYTGDMKSATGPVFIDIGVVAAGFFIIALMIVLRNAIAIKSENDLTI